MATTKTLTPTNETITIDAFQGEKPDHRHVADAETKLADAVNALNSNFAVKTSGDWSYIELPGKLCICWAHKSYQTMEATQSGALYIANIGTYDLPFTFASVPFCVAQRNGNDAFGAIIGTLARATTTKTPNYTLARPNAGSLYFGFIDFIVIGIKA